MKPLEKTNIILRILQRIVVTILILGAIANFTDKIDWLHIISIFLAVSFFMDMLVISWELDEYKKILKIK